MKDKLINKLIKRHDEIESAAEIITFELDGESYPLKVYTHFNYIGQQKLLESLMKSIETDLTEYDAGVIGVLTLLTAFLEFDWADTIEDNLKIMYSLSDLGVIDKVFAIIKESELILAKEFIESVGEDIQILRQVEENELKNSVQNVKKEFETKETNSVQRYRRVK